MARIKSQLLFLTTSPRTPEKMIPEIALLAEHFSGQIWNKTTQRAFMEILREEQFFNGDGKNDPGFSARDRINRAPKSLGFVTLSPTIELTPAGFSLLRSNRKEEIFLRQLLKFQIPSPYHIPTAEATKFWVKPYLEILRLIRTLGVLKFDELQLFGMQLTDWRNFDRILQKIEDFRIARTKHKGSYRIFKTEYLRKELQAIYADRIARGDTKTRESRDYSLEKFLKTQSSNTRDYADACFRYLRATGLVNVSHVGKSLSIEPSRITDVDYLLNTIDRNPCYVDDEACYTAYLGDSTLPELPTDNYQMLIDRLHTEFKDVNIHPNARIEELKGLLFDLTRTRKEEILCKQISDIKNYKFYDEIQHTFEQIQNNELYDTPLMLEWNTWRAMTMLDGGNIKANLNFDDFGNPLATAQGNMADIECDYGDYMLCVEVTMMSGQRQYDTEGEPVSRHLGKLKKTSGKSCYCLFIAPTINEACVAHFYALHHMNISYYGGKSVIVPLPLTYFQKMLEDSYRATYLPNPAQVRSFFEEANALTKTSENETQWFEGVKRLAMEWLKPN